ncbi:AAA family ATPase [Tenacibaculum ovolyticum]|uniref:AAA family ATPase n=1 Tax=Tenacibaculum ovolyticum TaxID=104270 RepID=UPI001F2BD21B|nr:AAA family ATPase [Tenacibaculum ovolyticum]
MSKIIDYNKFIEFVHQNFEDKVDLKDIEKLLSLEEDYNKDSPASLEKPLILNRLVFKGVKNNGNIINYDNTFSKGLNLWIADNGKGKSTIFKIIKYAMTGRNKLKPDIKRWVKEIILEFQIGELPYTIYVNKNSRISEGALYSFGIKSYLKYKSNLKLDTLENDLLFTFRGDDSFINQIQGFFFNQFSFYSLKYTQKSSKKDDPSLKTSNLSWGTYFKTIYLESKEHSNLYLRDSFGAQGSKIFEMILGLRLTYPINRLELLENKEDEEIGKLKLTDKLIDKVKKSDDVGIKNEFKKIEEDLKK